MTGQHAGPALLSAATVEGQGQLSYSDDLVARSLVGGNGEMKRVSLLVTACQISIRNGYLTLKPSGCLTTTCTNMAISTGIPRDYVSLLSKY